MPHGQCFLWRPDLLWLHVLSDTLIVLSYYSIPFALLYFVKKRTDFKYGWIMLLFGLFIFLCGTSHLMSIWLIWSPEYAISGIIKLLTAIASVTTAILIWPLLPKLLALPSPSQLQLSNDELEKTICQQRETEKELRKLTLAVEYGSSMIVITDDRGVIEYCNPMFYKTTGYEESEVIGKRPNILKSGLTDEKTYKELWRTIKSGNVWHGEFLDRKKNGDIYWCLQAISPVTDETNKITHFVSINQDISERKDNEKTIKKLAFYDPLTDLPNRVLFKERLEQAQLHSKREKSLFAVMYLDLDRFKNINDSLGHLVGDKLLMEIGKRLKSCLRERDTVARLGGDEFAVIVTELTRVENAGEIAQKIIDTIASPMTLEGHELFITTSVGISTFPNDTDDIEELIKNADKALYQAKDAGRNNYEYFNEKTNLLSLRRVKVEHALRNAISRKELVLHYQPKINLESGQAVGAEALLRWTHPELGEVSPVEFIPIAEETGLIIEIGEWVLKKACEDLNLWKQSQLQIPIAINLSARQFREKNLLQRIFDIREKAGISPELLEFEITESMIMDNPEEAIEVLKKFKQQGFKLSIDDFGTGYSSLSHLKRFPLDHLKIDYSFVRDITTDRSDACIVTAIIGLAHNLNLKVIAEGVSTDEQLAFLKRYDCEDVQGFYFSPPVNAEKLSDFLNEASMKKQ